MRSSRRDPGESRKKSDKTILRPLVARTSVILGTEHAGVVPMKLSTPTILASVIGIAAFLFVTAAAVAVGGFPCSSWCCERTSEHSSGHGMHDSAQEGESPCNHGSSCCLGPDTGCSTNSEFVWLTSVKSDARVLDAKRPVGTVSLSESHTARVEALSGFLVPDLAILFQTTVRLLI